MNILLTFLVFSVRAVKLCYVVISTSVPGPRALWLGHKLDGKNMVCNLQYVPQTWLVEVNKWEKLFYLNFKAFFLQTQNKINDVRLHFDEIN